jgi:hypothetical protein
MNAPRVVVFLLLGWAVTVADAAADESIRPRPVSAHNCYLENSASAERLVEALRLGIDNIEIDLGWDEAGHRLIVGHDANPRPDVAYADFEAYFVPAIEAHWQAPRSDGAPTVLTIDWKTSHPEAVRRFRAFLDAHSDWFSSAPKAENSPLTPRRLTVCFSGSDEAKDRYDALIPPGGTYRAFRDVVFGAGVNGYRPDVAAYVPRPSSAYHRFLAFHWSHVERGGPALAGSWTEDDAERLHSLVKLVHKQGFQVRFYCLNGHLGPAVGPYRFRDDAAALLRWQAARDAGADWIASDEYAEITRALGK